MKKSFFMSLMLFIAHWASGEAEMRTWTSKNGDTVEAVCVHLFVSGNVVLKTADGRKIKVPVDDLSDKDREYLASLVPPELDIDVDVDIDTDSVSTGNNRRVTKRETSKCKVLVKKTNREPSNRTFTVNIYVFAGQLRGDGLWLISHSKEKLTFADGRDMILFRCPAGTVEYSDASNANRRGYRYEAYLVVIEDEAGNLVARASNRGELEKQWEKFRGAETGAQFDKEYNLLSRKRSSSFGGR